MNIAAVSAVDRRCCGELAGLPVTRRSPTAIAVSHEDSARSQPDAVPGLMAQAIQPETIRVNAKRFVSLQRDPMHGHGERENRQKLTQVIVGD